MHPGLGGCAVEIRDGRPTPQGGGGSPPRLARKNDQIRGEVAGQNKGHILKSFQKRKVMMEQYCNTE